MLPDKIAFIDIETTGMRASFDRIIEIGILKAEKKSLKTNKYKLTKTFQTLVNPNGILSPEITTLTGINQALLESAPYFREIKSEVLEILDGCAIAAHNVRFDYGFLKQEFKRLDTSFSSKHFCTVKLSKLLFPKFSHHNLDSLIANLNIKCLNRHRAFDDAKVLWEFFQIILKSFSKEQIEKSLKQVLKQVSLPIKLSTDVLSTLPESSGVYIFLGSNNLPLYIGKSINIKERVMSHFSSDLRSNLEMKISQQIERIETITTTGELGALLKESSLIKKMQPLYNRKLRISKKLLLLKTTLEKNYTKIIFEPTDPILSSEIDQIFGVFTSLKKAKNFLINLAKEYSLCEKLLGLEKTQNACFGYRLGRCSGACIGKENFLKYNLRVIQAFSKSKIKIWPFDGAIVIEEKDEDSKNEYFVIDRWCFLGNFQGNDFYKPELNLKDYNFDLDTYKIISQFLRNPKNLKKVKLIKNYKSLQKQKDNFFSA